MDAADFRIGAIMSLCAARTLEGGPDGLIYEDESVSVEFKDGSCLITGKPFREGFTYYEVKGIS